MDCAVKAMRRRRAAGAGPLRREPAQSRCKANELRCVAGVKQLSSRLKGVMRTAAGITCTAFSAKTRAASSAKSSCGGARWAAARGAAASVRGRRAGRWRVLCGGNAPPQAGSRAVPSRTLLESRRRRRIQSTHALKCEF